MSQTPVNKEKLRGVVKAVADGTPYTLPGTIEDPAAVDSVRAALRTIGYPRDAL